MNKLYVPDFKPKKPDAPDNEILICIFNYRHNEQALHLLHLLNPYFKTVVLDSGNDKKINEFIQFDNIYYTGLWNQMKQLSLKNNYKWIGVIPSDITMSEIDENKLIHKISWLKTTSNIGQWQPSLTPNSRIQFGNVHQENIPYQSKQFLEGHFYFLRNDVLNHLEAMDQTKNKYGWGIDYIVSFLVTKLGLNNVFDNTLQIYHPKECGYDSYQASKEFIPWLHIVDKQYNLNIDFNSLWYFKQELGNFTPEYNENKFQNIKIWHYLLCYNEMKLLPYIVQYWKRYADKVIVYDNESTDGSKEFLEQFDWIEVRTYKSNNQLNDLKYIEIKDNAWKEAISHGVDFVIVGDLDEVLYSPFDIKKQLVNKLDKDIWVTNWRDMVSLEFPNPSEGMLLHQDNLMKMNINPNIKYLLFNTRTIKNSNYGMGCHTCKFQKFNNEPISYFKCDDLYILHFHNMGIDYVNERNIRNVKRMCQENINNRWGFEYFNKYEQTSNQIKSAYNNSQLFSNKI